MRLNVCFFRLRFQRYFYNCGFFSRHILDITVFFVILAESETSKVSRNKSRRTLESPKMIYRVCNTFFPMIYYLENPAKWTGDQVHAEYPEASGAFKQIANLQMSTLFGKRAPNISVVFESMSGKGCYGSVRDNQSDMTPIITAFPVEDFDKVNSVQSFFEGPLNIISTYKVDKNYSVVYADIVTTSLKSFDVEVWSLVVLVFLTFVVLLILRHCLNSSKEDKKERHDLEDSPIFETFSHFIGQEPSNFLDKRGALISLTMTLGCFFIIEFYLNIMCTDLVVETKPSVIKNYRDILDKENYTVSFMAAFSDSKEFENANEGSIQEEFAKRMKGRLVSLDPGVNLAKAMAAGISILKQESAMMMTSMFMKPVRHVVCKYNIAKDDIPELNQVHTWTSSDPQGWQHTQGLIVRQGLQTPLIMKGLRRTRRLFESDIMKIVIAKGIESIDVGPMMSGKSSFYDSLKCVSDTINYNSVVVEVVQVANFRFLFFLCIFMLLSALVVLIMEIYWKQMPTTVTEM